jgi:hypothetical protein
MRTWIWAAVCTLTLPTLVSCGLLIQIPDSSGIVYCPESENQVLSAEESPSVCFDFEVDRESVEALFTVKDAVGAVQGEYRWKGQGVSFHARPALTPGRRYVFSFLGAFHDLSGVEYAVHRITPFYYRRTEEPAPYLEGSSPRTGQTVSCSCPIRILFSEPIDGGTLTGGLSIEPETEILSVWENGDTELVLSAKEGWRNCCRYTIELGPEIRNLFGVPLAEPGELVFWVQEDVDSPRVLSVSPAHNLPARLYPPTGRGIEQAVGLDEALRIEFSESMDCNRTAGAMVVRPDLTFVTTWLDSATLVFVPSSGFASSTEYVVDFEPEATDIAGNSILFSGPLRFLTACGAITVSTELVNDGILLAPGGYSTATPVEIEPYPITTAADYLLAFHFMGAEFDSNSEKMAVQQSITLERLLPGSAAADPLATGFSWTGDRNLSITFSDLQFSTDAGRAYYLLRIRGGAAGVRTEEGHILEGDIEQLLVAKMQQEVR